MLAEGIINVSGNMTSAMVLSAFRWSAVNLSG